MSVILKDELLRRGYTYNELLLDRVYKQYFSPSGKLIITKSAYYDYPFITQTAKKISKDKTLSYAFAKLQGVKVPASLQTFDKEAANDFLATYKKVVVKPSHLGGGKGLTVDITDDITLGLALVKATFGTQTPLIQEQFIGEEVRITVIAGKVCSVILRQSPRVIGDGVSSIQKLIQEENEARRSLSFPLLSYPQLDETMINSEFFSNKSIPTAGTIIELSRATMIRKGASFYGILEQINPSYFDIAEKLATNLNPPMLVVDFMIKDFTKPVSNDNYIFLEFNTAPALEIYSSLRGGDQPDVVTMIADQVDVYAKSCN